MWFVAIVSVLVVASGAVPPFFGGVLVAVVISALFRNQATAAKPAPSKTSATVSIVGNIASGKSTALKEYAAEAPADTVCVQEPVDDWKPMLQQMATNSEAWMDLQITIACFYATLSKSAAADVVMQERDLMSVALFAGNRNGIKTLLMTLVETCDIVLPDVVVHVATSPAECFKRVNGAEGREQAGDDYAALLGEEYFERLHDLHDRLLNWYAANGCLIISISSVDTSGIALREAREQALAVRSEGPFRTVTKPMMATLLQVLWPPEVSAMNRVD